MRYSFTVHQKDAIENGIPNGNCLLVFEMVALASQWAEEHETGFFWTARQKISDELTLWKMKPDTIYRHLKTLQDLKLIVYKKDGVKDLTKLTKKGRRFFGSASDSTMSEIDPSAYVGNRSESPMSEIDPSSEIDPDELGNRSENSSEIDPTYNYLQGTSLTTKEKKSGSLKIQTECTKCIAAESYKLCPACRMTYNNARTFAKNMLKNQQVRRWDKYFDIPGAKIIADHWFDGRYEHDTETIVRHIEEMISNDRYSQKKKTAFSTAIQHAAIAAEVAA